MMSRSDEDNANNEYDPHNDSLEEEVTRNALYSSISNNNYNENNDNNHHITTPPIPSTTTRITLAPTNERPTYWQLVRQLQFFVDEDTGVPPGCEHRFCPLSLEFFVNNTELAKLFGTIGYPYFDYNRKKVYAIASLATILALIITIFGCCALSTDHSVVQRTYWAGGSFFNETTQSVTTLYIGLSSVITVNCPFRPGYDMYGPDCVFDSVVWSSQECVDNELVSAACGACSDAAGSLFFTAISSCLGLIPAFLGAQTRMRVAADSPMQKILGAGGDTLGTLMLLISLGTFHSHCLDPLQRAYYKPWLNSRFWSGPGIYCYAICATSGFVRAVVHWLTPLPGQHIKCMVSDEEVEAHMKAMEMASQQQQQQQQVAVQNPIWDSTRQQQQAVGHMQLYKDISIEDV